MLKLGPLSLLFCGLGSATVLVPSTSLGIDVCTGVGTSACPGTIQTFPVLDPGIFLASSVAPIYDYGQSGGPQIATITSAVFRQDAAIPQLTFYYQISTTNAALYNIADFDKTTFSGLDRRVVTTTDVGVRTDALGSYGSATFTSSDLLPSRIQLSGGSYNNLDVFFDNPSIAKDTTTATIVIHTDSPWYTVAFGGLLSTPFNSAGGTYGYGGSGVLAPNAAPEPGTTFLLLAGGSVLALSAWHHRRRFHAE
jgi:hypothetical protein